MGASGHLHSFGYQPVSVNDFSATCGKVTWQSEGEHCASVGYPYSLVERSEWEVGQAGVDLQTTYTSYNCDIGVSIFCLCCVRINIVHLNVSKVIYVGLARLEIPCKKVLVLLFCDFLLIDISKLKISRPNVTADRNLFGKKKNIYIYIYIYIYKHFYMPLGRLSYRLGVRGIVFRSPGGARDSLDLEVARVVLGPSQSCVPWVPGPFLGGKAPRILSRPLTSI